MKDFLTHTDRLLVNEAGLASTCIGQGLTILRKANFVNKWNYYQAFFLLTIGIERLLKIIVITKYRVDNNNNFPKDAYLKKLGHNIKNLICIVEKYRLNEDDSELITDEIQINIIDFFTDFAKVSRYYNIDALTGSGIQNDPLLEWKKIQKKIKIRESLISEPLPKGFIDFVNSFAVFIQYDEEGNLITGAEDFYHDSSILDKLQGYTIFHIWKIIQILVDNLRFLEYRHNLFPVLREFFPYFAKDWDKHIDVLTWDDWNYLK